ncbi:MAG TPA: hypothetical protein DCQ36_10780 [Actinobacteria bacterium]|jgi:predicted nucleic acid-binding protein|nr:hypothetical protein [Actinomycetota bacterium]
MARSRNAVTAIVLDASVLIAVMQPDDAHHDRARRIMRRHAPLSELLAHRVTLAESAVGAARGGRLAALQQAYARLGLQAAPTDEQEPWRVAALRASSGMSLPDCFVLDAATNLRASLATFDEALGTAARSAGVEVMTEAR